MESLIKYKIIEEIINSDDERVLNEIKELLKISEPKDFNDAFSEEEKAAIKEGIDQLNSGKHIPYKQVRQEIKSKFNF